MAGVGLAQWCQSHFRGAPSTPSGVHPGLWVHPGSAQCPRFSRKGLVWTYLTTQTSPDTVSHCSILREFLPLRKEVLFLLQEWRQLFFFFLTISVLLELTPKDWFSFSKERREVWGGHLFLQAAARLVYMQGSPSAPWLSLCFTLYLKLSELHCPGSQLYQYLLFYVNSFSA